MAAGALNTDNATLAAKVTALEIDYSDDIMATAPVIIGENAFAALTSLKTIKSLTPGAKVAAIPDNAFATAVYRKTLIVPEEKMGKYNVTDGWKNFKTIKSTSGLILGNANGDSRVTTADYNAMYDLLFNTPRPVPAYIDLNGDGRLTTTDYNAMYDLLMR